MKLLNVAFALMISGTLGWADVEIGQPAPEFEGRDIEGKTHKLSDYRGKIVVLEAYNLDCPFCANHFKTGAMQELQKEVTDAGGAWLIINSTHPKNGSYRDAKRAQAEFKAQKMHATAWIDDGDGVIGKRYGLRTTPHMVVIDAEGKAAYNGAIDDRPVAEGDPRKAHNYVQAAFQSLVKGEPVKVTRTKPYGCGVKYGN